MATQAAESTRELAGRIEERCGLFKPQVRPKGFYSLQGPHLLLGSQTSHNEILSQRHSPGSLTAYSTLLRTTFSSHNPSAPSRRGGPGAGSP